MFFGAVVQPGKAHPLVPHADGYTLHLSQASLAADVKTGTRASVLVRLGKEAPVVLCTLCAGSQDTVLLDQFMAEYAELSIQGGVPVHLTGYYSPQYGGPDSDAEDEDKEDEEYDMPGRPIDLAQLGLHGLAAGSSDEEESEELGDEDEDDSMDEDESDEDESSSGDEGGPHREPSVIIEDITEQENAKAAKASLANGDAAKEGKKRKAAAAALPAPEAGGAAAKKQALAAQQKQQQQTPADKKQQQQQTPNKQQQQQKTPNKQQQQQQPQQQKTPADKQQQQKKQAQEEKTPQSKAAATAAAAAGTPQSGKKSARVFDNGFEIHNVKMGDPHGKLAKGGKTVKVRYVGRLKSNGRVFDKTDKKPFAFRLGVGEVIKGWDRGVEGMRVGDKRKLVIPPQMGYGGQKTGPIPANSWLEFDVELLDVK